MDRMGKTQKTLKHAIFLPHEIVASMYECGPAYFDRFLLGQEANSVPCSDVPSTVEAVFSIFMRIIRYRCSAPDNPSSHLTPKYLSKLKCSVLPQAQALEQHWERERAIDPSFVEWLVSEGIDLAYAIPLRVYGDGAQALRISSSFGSPILCLQGFVQAI